MKQRQRQRQRQRGTLTSGWNCSPYTFFSRFTIAAKSVFSVDPTASNPGGNLVTLSPWEFQTWNGEGMPLKRRLRRV